MSKQVTKPYISVIFASELLKTIGIAMCIPISWVYYSSLVNHDQPRSIEDTIFPILLGLCGIALLTLSWYNLYKSKPKGSTGKLLKGDL